jgi:hypothetical protein
MMLTQDYLKSVLSYNPETGEFHWKRQWRQGKKAGTTSVYGYTIIGLDNVKHRAHRLAWLMHYGELPDEYIDHINGNRSDNRIENLRIVTFIQNSTNKSVQSNNKLGVKGVSYCTQRNKFLASIKTNGKKRNLGRYDTLEEAKAAYDAASLAFGEYRRTNETNKGYLRTHKAEKNDGRSQETI